VTIQRRNLHLPFFPSLSPSLRTLPRHGKGGLNGCHAAEGLLFSQKFPEDDSIRINVSSSGVGLEGGREGVREGVNYKFLCVFGMPSLLLLLVFPHSVPPYLVPNHLTGHVAVSARLACVEGLKKEGIAK